MLLRKIANLVSRVVNPNNTVIIRASNGFTIGPGAKQIPLYYPDITRTVQIQAVDEEFLKQEKGLNLEAVYQVMYTDEQLFGDVRLNSQGGDLVIINNDIWLTVKIIERYRNSFWCKVLLCLQYQ